MDEDPFSLYRWSYRPPPEPLHIVDLSGDGFGPDPCEGIFPDGWPSKWLTPADDRPLAKVLPFRRKARA